MTGASVVQEGSNISSGIGDNTAILAHLTHRFTANGTDAYRIDHFTGSTKATDGLGVAVSDGSPEIYLVIVLEKE